MYKTPRQEHKKICEEEPQQTVAPVALVYHEKEVKAEGKKDEEEEVVGGQEEVDKEDHEMQDEQKSEVKDGDEIDNLITPGHIVLKVKVQVGNHIVIARF